MFGAELERIWQTCLRFETILLNPEVRPSCQSFGGRVSFPCYVSDSASCMEAFRAGLRLQPQSRGALSGVAFALQLQARPASLGTVCSCAPVWLCLAPLTKG